MRATRSADGDLARHYGDARGWTITAAEQSRLSVLFAAARRRRAAKWVAKTVRDCTPFSVRVAANRLVATARDDMDAPLHAVLADPEHAVAMGEPLKLGNTATVVRYGELVVKRYNLKSQIHRWRWWARPSRRARAAGLVRGARAPFARLTDGPAARLDRTVRGASWRCRGISRA